MGQDVGQELGGQLQQLSRRLHRGGRSWKRQEKPAQLIGDSQSLVSVLVVEALRGGLAHTGQCGQGCDDVGYAGVSKSPAAMLREKKKN